jgi:hypothetical protein
MKVYQIRRINVLFFLVLLLGFEPVVFGADVPLIHSKEYQIVLKNENFLSRAKGMERVIAMLQAIEDNPKFDFKYQVGSGKVWERHVKRYDTNDGRLQASNIKLLVEQTVVAGQIQSKLKANI